MIKKYSTSDIGSIFKISEKKNLTCVKCGSKTKIEGEIGIDSLISSDKKDPTICSECKLKKGE